MTKAQPTQVIESGIVFPESPRWRDDTLWFVDMLVGKVCRLSDTGEVETLVEHDNWVSGIGWWPDNRMIVVGMEERKLFEVKDGGLELVHDLGPFSRYMTNDMIVDPRGFAYIGEVGYDLHSDEPFHGANLILVTPDSGPKVVASELGCPNGMAITPDGKTLLVAETVHCRITAFDIAEDGTLSNQRVWEDLGELQPDGVCLDAEGALWVCCPFQGQVWRCFGAAAERTLEFEFSNLPLACVFGGPARDKLFLCRSIQPYDALEANAGGSIETIDVKQTGAGLP